MQRFVAEQQRRHTGPGQLGITFPFAKLFTNGLLDSANLHRAIREDCSGSETA
jgi:hypothetical protein